MTQNHNEREFSRVSVQVKVEIDWDSEQFSAMAYDVSLNGVRIKSDARFDPEKLCSIRLILGDDGDGAEPIVIQAHGCAVRSDGEFVAVHFNDLDLEGYEHLKRLILYNAVDLEQVDREFNAHIGLHKKEDD